MQHLFFRCLPALLLATAVTVVLASVTQSLFNLWALEAIGVDLEPVHWVETVGADLLGFTPIMTVLTGAAFVVAFPVASMAAAWLIPARATVFFLAGAGAMLGALLLVDYLTPPPTLIAATRTLAGSGAFMGCGAVGGLLYARLSHFRDPDLLID